jgi:hypothetical protein
VSERRGTPSGVDRPKTAPTWVKLLVGFHVFATVVWALPNLSEKVMNGTVQPTGTKWLLYWNAKYLKTLSPVKAYLFSTGTWQYWDMFAPDPANTDWYCTAEIEYRDGTKKPGDYPRIYDLPIPVKFVKERYRKFYERAHDDSKPILWPTFAQRIALLGYTDPKNPPVKVRLTRNWRFVADPGKKQDEKYSSYTYYIYLVDRKQLDAAKGHSGR